MHPTLALDSRLLAILGRHLHAAHPGGPRHGPLPDPWLHCSDALAALNPQPLPPIDVGGLVAREFMRAAWLAERFGVDTTRLTADLDDWCPVPLRPVVNLPPGVTLPEPVPHPNWQVAFLLGFATQLAAAAFQPAPVRELAIEKSVRAIEAAVAATEA